MWELCLVALPFGFMASLSFDFNCSSWERKALKMVEQ